MIRKPYIIAIFILVAAATYFIVSVEKEPKPGSLVNNKPETDLRQSGEPAKVLNSSQSVPVQYPASANTTKGVTTQPNLKVNPVHGQPGHRCDIQVGDPLPPGSSATPQTSILPPASVSKQNMPVGAARGSSSAKLNPAHGEQGHRCDVQVGVPLPSS